MCGRFTQRFTWREIVAQLRLAGPPRNLRPRYNLAPGQEAAVLRFEEGALRLVMLRWGLVPGWARDPAIGSRLINARAETAAEKPSFRSAWQARRCLVPADGFYEWRRAGRSREPWLFTPRDGSVMAFAGLWERWRVPEGRDLPGSLAERRVGDVVETFTILTVEANETVRPVHGRMPAIAAPEVFGPWLAGEAVPLGPAPENLLTAAPVSSRVNSPRHDDPECVLSLGTPLGFDWGG